MSHPIRVYVVDDEVTILDAVGSLLAQDGYDVTTFGTASAALDRCLRDAPEIVVTDFVMPGMSGGELALALDERFGPGRPTLVCITGFASDLWPRFRRSFDRVLQKPFNYADLLRALRELEVTRASGSDG